MFIAQRLNEKLLQYILETEPSRFVSVPPLHNGGQNGGLDK